MSTYSLAFRSNNFFNASPVFEIIAGATVQPRLLELAVQPVTTATLTLGLGTPASMGIGVQSSLAFMADNPNDPSSQTVIATQWADVPSAPSVFMRRSISGNAIATGFIWTFPRGILISTTNTLVLWNNATGGLMSLWLVIAE